MVNNRNIVWAFLISVGVFTTMSGDAQAQTLGTMFTNIRTGINQIPWVLTVVAYLSGLFMGIWALFKFKDHVDNPREVPISQGVKRFFAAGMFLSGPYMYEVIFGTLHGANGAGYNKLTATARTAAGPLTPGSLEKMAVDLMVDIGGPVEMLLVGFTYIAGITLLLVGINRLTKRMEEGPRGPAGLGTIMTFISSAALFSFADTMGVFASTLFGDSQVRANAAVSATVITNAADRAKIEVVIEAMMAFIMIVGYIAFIRGWLVLKSFADGAQGATLAQGLTFLFGGALAINLGELVNAISVTLGIGGLTFG